MLTFPAGLLSNKGVSLDPEVSAWVTRVIANSGTVSATTIGYVNDFVLAIKAAGLRSRFLRLNLFVGDQLAACLTPLFLNGDGSGTFLGNTYDSNTNFVGGDYAESGASGGLQGDGSTKYLDTGFNPLSESAIGVGTGGLIVYNRSAGATSSGVLIGTTVTTPATTRLMLQYTTTYYNFYGMDNNPGTNYGTGAGISFGYRLDTANKDQHFNNTSYAPVTTPTIAKPNSNIKVFCSGLNATQYLFTNALLNCYAITDSVVDADAATLATLINNFYTNLSRNDF